MKNIKKILYVLFISYGISFSGLFAAAEPRFFESIDLFIKACMVNDTACAITMYNQSKDAYIEIKEKKYHRKRCFMVLLI